MMKKYIFILFGVLFSMGRITAQEVKLTIEVVDEINNPVAGAIILFDDVKQKIWTNSNGIFKIKLASPPKEIGAFHPKIGIRKVKYVEKDTIVIKIMKGNDLNLEANNDLDNPLEKGINSVQFNTIYDYLRGNIPGVNISSGNVIHIRGYSTVNGSTTPLFILNGMEISQENFGNIRPLEIESITVLKGSETAVYGIRGTNGVIIVKTK